MQQPPSPLTFLEMLRNGLIENIELDGFKGKLIIHIEALTIELHLSGSEPLESDGATNPINGEEKEA